MPRKRRAKEDEEEEEEEATPQAEIVADEAESAEEEQVLMKEDDDEKSDNDAVAEPAADQEEEEAEKDNDDEEEDDEEEETSPPSPKRIKPSNDTDAEAQASSPPRPLNRPGHAATVGILQQVRVENFMCHRKLRVDLCRHINFIHGQNGSGKSAILAALQICLGAGARRTHRARNLAALVRTDASRPPTHAKVSVTLRNEGPDAFRPEDFGDRITVERIIPRSGAGGGYKLCGADGREVSKARKDLDDMLDHMNIQVENPVAILDQEEAKKFLTGKASDKYQFFLNACELERLSRAYASIADNLQDAEDAKAVLSESLINEQNRVTQLKQKYEQHKQLDKLQMKLLTEQCRMAWAVYAEQARELEEAQAKKEEFERKAAKKREELTQVEQQSQEAAGGHESHEARVKELSDQAGQYGEEKTALQKALKEATQPYKQADARVKQLARKEKQARDELSAAESRLQRALQEMAENDAASQKAQLATALAQAETDLAEARGKEPGMKTVIHEALEKYEAADVRILRGRQEHERLERQHQAARSKYDELAQQTGRNSLAAWGRNAPRLHAAIEQHRSKFQGPVLGPIGAYLKIVPGKEAYASLAEAALGFGTLDRFIVTNNHDRVLVQKMRQKLGCQNDCGLFLMSPDQARFRVPTGPEGVETVATVLQIEENLVFNCLVDNTRMDQIALCKDMQKSEQRLITTNGKGEKIIKGHIRNVFCLPRGDSWSIRKGQQGIISNTRPLKQTIGTDKTAIMAQMKREMEELSSQVRSSNKELDALNGKHTEYKREWNQYKKAHAKHIEYMDKLTDKIDKIKEDMTAVDGQTIDTSEYEDDVEQQRENLKKFTDEKMHAEEERDELKPAVEEARSRMEDNQRQTEKVIAQLDSAEKAMTKFLETQSHQKQLISNKRQKLEKYESIMNLHVKKITSFQAEADDCLYKARKLHFRMQQRKEAEKNASHADELPEEVAEPTEDDLDAIQPTSVEKSADYYNTKMKRIEEKIETERKRQKLTDEDPTEAYQRYIDAKQRLSVKLDEINKLDATIENYSHDLKARQRRWKQFQKHLQTKTTEKFADLLSVNKYVGDLLFDNETKELNLHVQKANAAESQSNDVRGLSGGERSYTTIALLLALGESLETPFRCADEFDVFLDPQVRKLVISELIYTARQLKHRQFIFLTPQDLSSVTPAPDLKIFSLLPPERNSHDASLTQQTLDVAQP